MLTELGLPPEGHTPIYEDNASKIHIVNNQVTSKYTQ